MNIYNPKHSPRARRKIRNRDLQKPVVVREPAKLRKSTKRTIFTRATFVPTPYSVTDEAKKAYESNAVAAHEFHAKRSVHGTFSGQRKELRVKQVRSVPPATSG